MPQSHGRGSSRLLDVRASRTQPGLSPRHRTVNDTLGCGVTSTPLQLGISKNPVETCEDGMRTTGKSGSYEWWYFDSRLEDGSTLVIVFYTKSPLNPNTDVRPRTSSSKG